MKCLIDNKKLNFLVDTGAEVCILPKCFRNDSFPLEVNLQAANGSAIESFGYVIKDVVVPSLRRAFKTKLVVADVQQPILGLNFFHDNNLSINVRDR